MMKEKATIPKRVKGTVLFTVVAVMMVMVVMLTATLALATTANNRAMNNYNQAQTQAAAKSAVEAILSAMQNDGDLAQDANSLSSTSAPIKIDNVGFYENGKPPTEFTLQSMGHLKDAAIEYYGTKYILNNDSESDTYGQMEAANVLKVWATVEQGGQDSTYAAYVMNGSHSGGGGGGGGGGGFVTTGTAVNGTKTSAYGGTYIGYDKNHVGADMWAQNEGTVYETPFAINGNLGQGTKLDFVIRGKKQGITVWENFLVSHGNLGITTVNANKSKDFSSDLSYIDLPYLYVGGVLATDNGSSIVLKSDSSHFDVPLNLFCGQLVLNRDNDLSNMNVYCYTPYDGTNLQVVFEKSDGSTQTENYTKGLSEFKGPNLTALYNWAASVIDVNNHSITRDSGNYYTKGNLKFNTNGGFARNVYVDGDMEISSGKSCNIGGDLYVAGTLNNNGNLNVTGTIYCDNVTGTKPSNVVGLRPGFDHVVTIPGAARPGYTTAGNAIIASSNIDKDNIGMVRWVDPATNTVIADAHNLGWHEFIQLDGGKYYFRKYRWDMSLESQEELIPPAIYKDTSGNIVPSSEAFEPAQNKYCDASGAEIPLPYGNPIDAETFFPEEYENDVVTGLTTVDSLKSLSADEYKQKTQIVKTVQDVMDGTVNPYNTKYEIPGTYQSDVTANHYVFGGSLGNVTVSGANANIAKTGTNEFTITSSCSIEGNAYDARIIFEVEPDKELWVEIVGHGLHFSDRASGCLIQETSKASLQPTAGQKPGKLNILLNADTDISNPSSNDLSFDGGGRIAITTTYIENLIKSGDTFQLYTDAAYKKSGIPTIEEIPISIYSGKNSSSDEAAHRLHTQNNVAIIANICAPYLDYDCGSQSYDWDNNVYYNGFPIRSKPDYVNDTNLNKITVIGCCNVAQLSDQANDFVLLYVPREIETGGPKHASDEDVMTNWKIQFYENY